MSQAFIDRIVELTNLERSKAGLPALQLNSQLTSSAQGHSQEMALQDYFNHTGLDGSTASTRTKAAGYQGSYSAENIGAGYSTPEEAIQGWINSSGHAGNILNPNINEIGVGYYYLPNDTGSTNGNYYWTQVFGKSVGVSPTPSPTPIPIQRIGTNGSEALTGSTGNDIILGLGGNDTVSGAAGNDYANGNIGNDTVKGDAGDDTILGGQNEDFVMGGAGDDQMVNGNKGNDQVYGGDGHDIVHGGQNNDSVFGEAGDDELYGDLGADTLIGGAGADTYVLRADATDIIYFTDGEDFIRLPTFVYFDELRFNKGSDQYVQDNQLETQILNTTTGQVLAVLPGIDPSSLNWSDFQ
ncbi:CAP domain-containing protein [Microcoleus sp. FACHB-672]|uniref:CAP domain-containing protein n=1 Tax=Microcoleus sp. FACHB-672 TaxID=2692825 RepID=UPI001683DF5E|nr:CAP domain-containing protein [Microcoleus sp. FACHB-672]MBD2042558.1 SCP-like extracellular [Microcoleus sp. FACHB-672]